MPRLSDDAMVTVDCPGKVNLSLHISPRRAEWGNRHGLDTIYAGVDLMDTVTVTRRPRGTGPLLTMRGDHLDDWRGSDLDGNRNHAVRALEAMSVEAGLANDVHIDIVKRIPIAAGLAGGSADAAGVILAINALWNLEWPLSHLRKVASSLGADMPFCLSGGIAHGGGYGEIITAVDPRGSDYRDLLDDGFLGTVLLGAYDEKLSTPDVYAAYDRLGAETGDANDLQRAAIALHPRSGDALRTALDHGARHAVVSGSGPTVAAFCPNDAVADMLSDVWLTSHIVDYAILAHCPSSPSVHVDYPVRRESGMKDTVKPIMIAARG
ncbi:4-(cytidine 5'-diphospho)-2-C-methyl-D-erythritol kinase [uncultured Bifidobacterium sp.]|uniref:4-(cytidine 5'-diphospho)-2-C-methyl-D-erythritol kinase n=1 Tax=uncultured Bifidobacterium sp. TaxID=165187 RepID=UPI00261F9E99|nr:4-(cytidine 5'-diphospho)-2-C-methyl-D-erythritol kinase [uncultured Bifidobacterium sp.]